MSSSQSIRLMDANLHIDYYWCNNDHEDCDIDDDDHDEKKDDNYDDDESNRH